VILADACDEFRAVAEALQIPVVASYMGKSGIPWNHPLMAGQVGIQCNTPSGNKVFLDSTLVFAVGARFNDRHTGDIKVYKGNRKFIHVDIDPAQMGKNIPPDLGICADAKMTLQALLEEIERRKVKPRPVDLKIPQIRAEMERKTDYGDIPIKPQRVFKEINEFFDEETVFVTCIGLNQIWSGQLQKISKPRHYLDCGGAGPLKSHISCARASTSDVLESSRPASPSPLKSSTAVLAAGSSHGSGSPRKIAQRCRMGSDTSIIRRSR